MLELLITMGCLPSKTPSEDAELPEFGPDLYTDYQELAYLRGRVALLDRELYHLESRLDAQIAIADDWQAMYWDLRREHLSLGARPPRD